MEDEVLYDLGVDISSDLSFHDGDLVLCKYEDNLVQSIVNRLNTDLDELDLFYEEYGSILTSFLGWKANDETISFIESELETVLKSDERLTAWEYDVTYNGDGKLTINLKLYPNMEYSIDVTLTVNNEGTITLEDEEEE